MLFCGKVQKVVVTIRDMIQRKIKLWMCVCVCVKTEGSKICFGELSSTEKVLIIKCNAVCEKVRKSKIGSTKNKAKIATGVGKQTFRFIQEYFKYFYQLLITYISYHSLNINFNVRQLRLLDKVSWKY